MKLYDREATILGGARFHPERGSSLADTESLRQRCLADAAACERSITQGKGSRPYIRAHVSTKLSEWKRAVALGVREAQWLLGRCYDEGLGVEMSRAHAIGWHLKAAEQGYPPAQCHMGSSYQNGSGVRRDEAEAVKWYRRAAHQGYAAAQSNLGWCYDSGSGVAPDATEAVKWYRRAALQNDETALYNLGVHYEWGSGVAQDKAEAVKWYRRAGEQGYEEAEEALKRLTRELPERLSSAAETSAETERKCHAEGRLAVWKSVAGLAAVFVLVSFGHLYTRSVPPPAQTKRAAEPGVRSSGDDTRVARIAAARITSADETEGPTGPLARAAQTTLSGPRSTAAMIAAADETPPTDRLTVPTDRDTSEQLSAPSALNRVLWPVGTVTAGYDAPPTRQADGTESPVAPAAPAESQSTLAHETVASAIETVGPLLKHQPGSAYVVDVAPGNVGQTRLLVSQVPETVLVPVVMEAPQHEAARKLTAAGLVPRTRLIFSPGHTPGEVVRQHPEPGAEVAPNTEVTLEVAQTELAIQPAFSLRDDTNEKELWGQLIVHRPFDVELPLRIQHVPILAIAHVDDHDRGGNQSARPRSAEARARAVAERLSIAWTLLDDGAYLDVADSEWIGPDDHATWQLSEPEDAAVAGPNPAIYLRHSNLGPHPLRIITVYPEDALSLGTPRDATGTTRAELTQEEAAAYLVALIKAHHLLFHKRSTEPADYDKLEIVKTREGDIFKEICLRAREATEGQGVEAIRHALARIAMAQRARLTTLAFKAPEDWRLRHER